MPEVAKIEYAFVNDVFPPAVGLPTYRQYAFVIVSLLDAAKVQLLIVSAPLIAIVPLPVVSVSVLAGTLNIGLVVDQLAADTLEPRLTVANCAAPHSVGASNQGVEPSV